MKSNMWKSTFREIKQSFGRFAAIFAIIALGVSLFAGLKVIQPAMVTTTDTYYKEKAFYNYRLLSTLGYEQEDVAYVAAQEDVRIAEGAINFDILCNVDGSNGIVLKSYNVPEEINNLELVAGRMPEYPQECLLDSAIFSEDIIGEHLVLSKENEADDLEHFLYTEYEIVGLAQSSNYIQFERGNTSLGNGKIKGFFYIPKESFDVDYYTEILVKFHEDYTIYSDEYLDYMDEKEFLWEGVAQKAANARYDRIVTEANQELADAKSEFETEKAEAEAELLDAKNELADAKKELLDAEKELANAKNELSDGKQELSDGKEQLEDGRWDLCKAETELLDGEEEVLAGMEEIERNYSLLSEKQEELTQGAAVIEEGQVQLDTQKQYLEEKRTELEAAQKQLDEQKAQIENGLAQIELQKAEIEKQKEEILKNYGVIPSEQEAVFEQALQQLESSEAQLDAGFAQINDAQEQLKAGWSELEAGQKQLDEAQAELDEQRSILTAGHVQLETAKQELDAAKAELEEAKSELETGKKQIKKAWETLSENEAELLKGEQELLDGEKELADAERELEDGWQKYYEGLQEYEDGYQEFCAEIADAEAEIADAEAEIAEIEAPESYVLGRETNVGYVCFENDSSIIDAIANVFPIFFYAVAALVCMTTMNRMVEEQRTQIGVLKALGYSQFSIIGKYLFYSGAAAVAGCIFGYFFGTWFFPKVIWFAYGTMYDVDDIVYVFDAGILIFSLIISMACSMGTTYLTCRKELSEVAAELMRPKAPKAGKRVLLERIPYLWNKMKFLHKVSYRNVFRYKKRFFMMVVGISGCTGLVLTGFGVQDSIASIADDQYDRIQVYDINVMLTDEVTDETGVMLEKIAGERICQYVYAMEKSVDLTTEHAVKSVSLIAVDEAEDLSPFVNLSDGNGEILEFPGRGECILTDKIADTYGLQIGDSVVLTDENNRRMELQLSGIAENYLYNFVYMSVQTYEKSLGEAAEQKSIYLNITEDTDAHQLTADLMKEDAVVSASVSSDSKIRFASMIESLDLLVVVIILCAAFLAFIVLYNLTNINITERIREIATIKVLGFHKNETASYIFRENLILTLIGALLGMLLGNVFHAFVMSQVQVDQVSFNVRILPMSYVYSFVLTFVFAMIVNRFMRGKLDKISMTESLKSVD